MGDNVSATFIVRHTADFQADGKLIYEDVGLDLLESASGIDYAFLETFSTEVEASSLNGIDALICLSPRISDQSLAQADRLGLIARFGVGYDSVDVDACTSAGVLLTITTGAVDYSVAESTVTFMLALSHNLTIKDRITREGRWDERSGYMGSELRDRTLGIVGLGGIGARLARMVDSFGMAEVIAFDPYVSPERATEAGVRLVSLEELMTKSDFVSVNCPLNEETKNLIGAEELGQMKSTAYLINTARGGIVNEQALIDALRHNRISGAGLDCHENEPVVERHPMEDLDNVILSPHAIAWTNELFRDIGRQTCRQVLELANGRIPEGAVNPEVVEAQSFRQKLERYG